MKFKIISLLLLLLLLFYTIIATEHKSHSNLTTRTYKQEDNLNMNKTCSKYTRFSIWIMPHWRRIQTSLLDPAPLGTAIFRCHAFIYLSTGRCESRRRYTLKTESYRRGKIDYIKIFRGYFTKYVHASTLFLFNTSIFVWKQMYV